MSDPSNALGPEYAHLRIAVLVPCLNEEVTIGTVVENFRAALPEAEIYVCDNGSIDRTTEIAAQAGAHVISEPLRGKGNAIRRVFADVEADAYLMIDGDDTYDAASSPKMVAKLFDDGLDVVYASRVDQEQASYRPGHRFGNKLLTSLVVWAFDNPVEDMLSGFRVFSRRFVKSFPAHSSGFEIETELTIHALELRMPSVTIPTPYKARPENSSSKLSTYRDGLRILMTIIELVKTERPLFFFTWLGVALVVGAVGTAIPQIILPWMETGTVIRIPTAVLVTGMALIAFMSFSIGLVLDTVTRGRREAKRLGYLATCGPSQAKANKLDESASR